MKVFTNGVTNVITEHMKRAVRMAIMSAVALFLSACGVQIQMTTIRPADVDLGRGATLSVHSHGEGRYGARLAEAFRLEIGKRGFYALGHHGDASIRLSNVYVSNPPPPPHRHRDGGRKDERRSAPIPRLHAVVTVNRHGYQLYRRDYSESVYVDSHGHMDILDACEEFAEEIMDDLTPRMVRYSEYITPDETNPALEQAARACAAGNWARGRELARSAISVNSNCAEAYYLLGLIARNEGDYEESDNCFAQAYSLQPISKYSSARNDNARLRHDEARAYQQMNR